MRVTYDAQADAAYIYLVDIGNGEAQRTKAVSHEGIMLDFNAHGALIGIEILDATRRLPAAVIAASEQIGHDPMLPTSLKLGMTVEFDPKVFQHPYAPHYDAYKGHRFQVVAFHPLGHVEVICVDDPSVSVAGHVHDNELVELKSPPKMTMNEYEIALFMIVRQRGSDASDAGNRALFNLGLRQGTELIKQGPSSCGAVAGPVMVVREPEVIMVKPSSPERT